MRHVLITGGSGTLGTHIIQEAVKRGLPWIFTVLSRDPDKQHRLRARFPETRFVVGDVMDPECVDRAMVGQDWVIHAAAMKHIPEGEYFPTSMYRVNVEGSLNVAQAAIRHQIERVLGISTDKACHPVNAYGCSKMMLERSFWEMDRLHLTDFRLIRYGNVIDSTGSVLPLWRSQLEREGKVTLTDGGMTRFWLPPWEAGMMCLFAILEDDLRGLCYIPKLPSLSMKQFLSFTLGDVPFEISGLRPGEKIHEELTTSEELPRIEERDIYFRLAGPTIREQAGDHPVHSPYTSDASIGEVRRENLRSWLGIQE